MENAADAVQRALSRIKSLTDEQRSLLFMEIGKLDSRFLTIGRFEGDVSQDADFQRTFNWFYQVRRNQQWRSAFYQLFQELGTQNRKATFEEILSDIYSFSNQWEYSFATKMLHTLDDSKPIIDAKVMRFLGIPLKRGKSLSRCVEHYNIYCQIIKTLLRENTVRDLLAAFDKNVPALTALSAVKKLDLLMWKWNVPIKYVADRS